jgi:hypothetical protein
MGRSSTRGAATTAPCDLTAPPRPPRRRRVPSGLEPACQCPHQHPGPGRTGPTRPPSHHPRSAPNVARPFPTQLAPAGPDRAGPRSRIRRSVMHALKREAEGLSSLVPLLYTRHSRPAGAPNWAKLEIEPAGTVGPAGQAATSESPKRPVRVEGVHGARRLPAVRHRRRRRLRVGEGGPCPAAGPDEVFVAGAGEGHGGGRLQGHGSGHARRVGGVAGGASGSGPTDSAGPEGEQPAGHEGLGRQGSTCRGAYRGRFGRLAADPAGWSSGRTRRLGMTNMMAGGVQRGSGRACGR